MRHVGRAESCLQWGQAGLGTPEPWVLVPALLGLGVIAEITEAPQLLPPSWGCGTFLILVLLLMYIRSGSGKAHRRYLWHVSHLFIGPCDFYKYWVSLWHFPSSHNALWSWPTPCTNASTNSLLSTLAGPLSLHRWSAFYFLLFSYGDTTYRGSIKGTEAGWWVQLLNTAPCNPRIYPFTPLWCILVTFLSFW